MKKGFKKFLGATVTAVATICLSLGITSCVYAASGDAFTLLPADFYAGQTAGYTNGAGKASPTTTSLEKEGATIALKSGSNYYGVVTSDSYLTAKKKTIEDLTNGTDLTITDATEEICFGGARTITITPAANGTISFYWYDGGAKDVTVGSNATVDATNWTVTKESASCTKDTAFVINCGGSNVCMLAVTFTPSGSTGGDETTTKTDGTTEATTEGTTEATTEAAARVTISDKATLTVGESDAVDKSTNDIVCGTYFTLMNGISVDKNSKTVDGLGSYTYRIKTNGKTKLDKTTNAPTNRAIVFDVAGPASLQVVGMSGSSSAERSYNVYSADGTVLNTVTVAGDKAYASDIISLPAAGTYYIACASDACNFYSVNVVVGSGVKNNADGSGCFYADKDNGYMIAKVSASDMSNSKLTVTANGTSVDTDTVYAAALIDGNLITATSLSTDYIYVVKANNAGTSNSDKMDSATAFTVSFN